MRCQHLSSLGSSTKKHSHQFRCNRTWVLLPNALNAQLTLDLVVNLRERFHQEGRTKSFKKVISRGDAAMPQSPQPTEFSPLLNNGAPQEPEHERPKFWGDNDLVPWRKHAKRSVHVTWLTMTSSYVNILLIFVPLGIIGGILKWNASAVFVLNFLAIVPLAALLGFTTEELSAELGQTVGGLLNATFGNAVELIVSIVALLQGQIRIVQSSMLGSILSNILLVSAGNSSQDDMDF